MHNVVHDKNDVLEATRAVINEISTIVTKTGSNHILVTSKSGILIHTRMQTIFNLKFSNKICQTVHEIIMSHALKAEQFAPGGFDMCLDGLIRMFNNYDGDNANDRLINFQKGNLSERTRYPTINDVDWLLKKYFTLNDEKSLTMLKKSIELAGFTGKILVEKTESSDSVELIRGYTFIQPSLWNISVKLKNVKIVCIDGYVETVAEIHHLFEAAAETKEDILLFVRGLSEDVKNTLRVNYDRGTLRIIPIIVKFDIHGINALNDISIVAGTDLISSSKGDLINKIDLLKISRVEQAILYQDRVVIINNTTRKNVNIHVQYLKRKRSDEKNEELAKLIDDRIRSLTPNHVIIRLSNDKNFILRSQSIDYSLRALKALVQYGVLTTKNELFATTHAAYVHSHKCFETLSCLGTVLTS